MSGSLNNLYAAAGAVIARFEVEQETCRRCCRCIAVAVGTTRSRQTLELAAGQLTSASMSPPSPGPPRIPQNSRGKHRGIR